MIHKLLIACCSVLSYAGYGQGQDFFLNGSAVQLSDSCFRLTQEGVLYQVGSIWHPEKVDLRNDFDLVMDMFFGCTDEQGADGIVFGLQPISAAGGWSGDGLGIGGVRPSLGVEFDTYHNSTRFDPLFDHVAIMANGEVTHDGPDNLAGPVSAREQGDNIESCSSFSLRVTWDATIKSLKVYFDCSLRLEYQGDIVEEIFGGDPMVFYGFAASTGELTNRQEICFRFNSFQKQLQDVTMCPGGSVLLDATGGERYEWSPATGLSSTMMSSVKASPESTTVYTVKIFDACGIPVRDTVRVTVAGDSAFVKLGGDATLCPGEELKFDVSVPTAVYSWNDPALSGAVVLITESGTYSVTATRTDIFCTSSDRIKVKRLSPPNFDIGVRDTTLCQGEVLRVIAQYPDAQAYLSDGTPIDSLDITHEGSYGIYLDHPCALEYDEVVVKTSSCRNYFLPTAFSPNYDGNNDYFFPLDNGDVIKIHRFAVFNRWGILVFESDALTTNLPEAGWDGRFRDGDAPSGQYVWMMEADFRDGSRTTERGGVTLVR